jgi:hypothetical protein
MAACINHIWVFIRKGPFVGGLNGRSVQSLQKTEATPRSIPRCNFQRNPRDLLPGKPQWYWQLSAWKRWSGPAGTSHGSLEQRKPHWHILQRQTEQHLLSLTHHDRPGQPLGEPAVRVALFGGRGRPLHKVAVKIARRMPAAEALILSCLAIYLRMRVGTSRYGYSLKAIHLRILFMYQLGSCPRTAETQGDHGIPGAGTD